MSELWDCYDSNFNIVKGKILVRGEEATFSDDEYHLVSDVVVRHTDGTFLLMQRDLQKDLRPGYWELTAGGSALQGETPLMCAKRELREETGLLADTLLEVGRKTVSRTHCHFVIYLATVSCDKDSIVLQEGETIAYQWLDKGAVLGMLDKLASKRALEMLPELTELWVCDELQKQGFGKLLMDNAKKDIKK